jgi:hypothetical protein
MDLSLIPLKNNLLVDAKYNTVKQTIIERIVSLGLQDQKYKTDNEFLTLVCNLIENLITKKDKVSKQNLAIDILDHLFNLTDEEKETARKNIDFLCSQINIIKKVSYYKLFKTGLKECFFKKS